MTDRDGMYVHVTAKGAMSFRTNCQLDVLAAIDDAAIQRPPKWPPCFYGV
jgi:hypothetical protein